MVTTSSAVRVPALIGGVPDQTDLAPSILFAVLYVLSLIPHIIHYFNSDTRTITFCLGTVAFSIERIVVWSLRASLAKVHHPGDTLSKVSLSIFKSHMRLDSYLSQRTRLSWLELSSRTLRSKILPEEAQTNQRSEFYTVGLWTSSASCISYQL